MQPNTNFLPSDSTHKYTDGPCKWPFQCDGEYRFVILGPILQPAIADEVIYIKRSIQQVRTLEVLDNVILNDNGFV